MAKKLSLTRSELASFLKTHEQIKQFESLFSTVEGSTGDIGQLTTGVSNLSQDIGSINLSLNSINAQIAFINTSIQKYFGQFSSSVTQTAAVINTAYAMTLDTSVLAQNVIIGTVPSRIYVYSTRIYNIQFSAQFDNTSGGSHLAFVWLRVNGIDVPQTASQIRLKGTDGELVASWNFLHSLNSGDYFEIMWSVNDIAIQLTASGAVAPVPSIPSVIVSCYNVN
jgi:uncharacterized protein YoxC